MEIYGSGCIICGSDLNYREETSNFTCSVCSGTFRSNVQCAQGHFVCDNCHRADALEYIEQYCRNSSGKNPLQMAVEIMKNPKIKMHGPEHHFLVPAVLLTTYYNTTGSRELLDKKLPIAKERAQKVPGGFCGNCGNCGAGVGTGIFMSIITETTPLSGETWKLANLMTAKSLEAIALHGGPRCCKRDVSQAIETAVDFVQKNLNVSMAINPILCEFSEKNKECKKQDCKYYPG